MVARDGIEPPTPAFSGPSVEYGTELIMRRKCNRKCSLSRTDFRLLWADVGNRRQLAIRVLYAFGDVPQDEPEPAAASFGKRISVVNRGFRR